MDYTGNYKWLENLTTVYGPVSLHMVKISFIHNKKRITMNLLLMGDIHTEAKNIKETDKLYKLQNFVLNIPKTNKKCFDFFIETFSPHILKNLGFKKRKPNQRTLFPASSPEITLSSQDKNSRPISNIDNLLSVGTDVSIIHDSKNYKIPLVAMRETPLLLQCRYHELRKFGMKQKCSFPNIRYHSWDLRFTNIESDLTILSDITMTYDFVLYKYFQDHGVTGEEITQFLMFRTLNAQLDSKIRRLYYAFYEKIMEKLKKDKVPENIQDLFSSHNINADYTFHNFDKQKKLVQKQFRKIPVSLRTRLLKSFIKIYNNPYNYVLAITDFYAICRMLSKFKNVPNRPLTCHNPEYLFCQNIIYYAGGQHTELMLSVFLDMFGNKSLEYTTGSDYVISKRISIKSFKSKSKNYPNVKKPKHFLDVVSNFYKT